MNSDSIGVNERLERSYATMKRVNTTNSLVIPDEDRNEVMRSDVGKKLTEQIHQTTTAKKRRENKTQKLLENPDIRRWHSNTARGSPITAETRLRRLIRFCEIQKMTPMELAELGTRDLRAVTNLLEDHITWMEEHNYAPQYIEAMITALKSWLRHSDIQIKRRLKIANSESTPTLENERVPDASEMSEILSRAPLREGTIISLMAKAGLRPEVLGNHNGTDGLMIKDLPDLEIANGIATFRQLPAKVIVRRTLSKARHQYFTFLSDGGAKRILAYLNDRLAKGEMLNGESAVIAPNRDYKYGRQGKEANKFLLTVRISNVVRNTFRPILSEELVKEMRESFKRSEELLDLELPPKVPSPKQKDQNVITSVGQMQEGLEYREQLTSQKVVSSKEAEKLIAEGWRFVAVLPNSKVILEKILMPIK